MSTCVFYVDESGSVQPHTIPLQPGQTPLFVLAAVALPLSRWREFDRDYLSLKRLFYRSEMSRAPGRSEQWEMKGKELVAPRNRHDRRHHQFVLRLLQLCQTYRAHVFGVTFVKNPLRSTHPMSLYTIGLQRLAEGFHTCVDETEEFENGIVILDSREQKWLDFQVGTSFLSFVFGHERGQTLTTLAEGPLFADSRLTAGLQIVDNIAALLYSCQYDYYCRHLPGAVDYSHVRERGYWELLCERQFFSQRRYDVGYYSGGIYVYNFAGHGTRSAPHRPHPSYPNEEDGSG